jgi:hypothetical protein
VSIDNVNLNNFHLLDEKLTLNHGDFDTNLEDIVFQKLDNPLARYPFVPPWTSTSQDRNTYNIELDYTWAHADKERDMVYKAYQMLSDSPEARAWFEKNWGKDIFEQTIQVSYTGRFGQDPLDWFALLYPGQIAAFTDPFTGNITFLPNAFSSEREVTATLMHELNNVAAGLASPAYDNPSSTSEKGSYKAELVGYSIWDAAHQ